MRLYQKTYDGVEAVRGLDEFDPKHMAWESRVLQGGATGVHGQGDPPVGGPRGEVVTTRVAAWLDGENPTEAVVFVDGNSLAHAVRQAVRSLGVGVGQTRSKTETAPGEWRWDWSGTILQVRIIPHTEPFSELLKPAPPMHLPLSETARDARVARPPATIDLRFGQRVTVQLSNEACAELARGGVEHGGRHAYVEALLREAAARRSRTGAAR